MVLIELLISNDLWQMYDKGDHSEIPHYRDFRKTALIRLEYHFPSFHKFPQNHYFRETFAPLHYLIKQSATNNE